MCHSSNGHWTGLNQSKGPKKGFVKFIFCDFVKHTQVNIENINLIYYFAGLVVVVDVVVVVCGQVVPPPLPLGSRH